MHNSTRRPHTPVSSRRRPLPLLSKELGILLCIVGIIAASSMGSPENCRRTCDLHVSGRDAYCSRRNLTEVPSACSDCVVINLSDNLLRSMGSEAFSGFPMLRYLDLSKNELQELLPRQFQGAPGLNHVYMLNNEIRSLEDDTFYGLGNMTKLYLSNNLIEAVGDTAFSGMGSLKVLFLSHNRIGYISIHVFRGNPGLTHLILADNRIEIFLPQVFDNLRLLEYIDLSDNKLVSISAFQDLPSLTYLRATNNNLTVEAIEGRLPGHSADGVREIDVRYNLIETVPALDEESDLRYLRLANNPLICDCRLRYLQALYQSNIGWAREVTCANGEPLVDTVLSCPPPSTTEIIQTNETTTPDRKNVEYETQDVNDNQVIIIIIVTVITSILLIVTIIYTCVGIFKLNKDKPNYNKTDMSKAAKVVEV